MPDEGLTECHCSNKIDPSPEFLIKNQKKFDLSLREVKKKLAFTLAEVLIVIAIIGVVAVLTLPNLINKANKKSYAIKLKKTIGVISNAARINKAVYDWDFSDIGSPCNRKTGVNDDPETIRSICALFNKSLKGATFYSGIDTIKLKNGSSYYEAVQFPDNSITSAKNNIPVYVLPDGALLILNRYIGTYGGCSGSNPRESSRNSVNGLGNGCYGYIDVNGILPPNKITKCTTGNYETLAGYYNPCTVEEKDIQDIFYISFHDTTAQPLSNSAIYVFNHY